jgi:hypothetical protein
LSENNLKKNPYEPTGNKALKSLEKNAYLEIEQIVLWLLDGAAGGYRAAYNDYIESEHSEATQEYVRDLETILAILEKHQGRINGDEK